MFGSLKAKILAILLVAVAMTATAAALLVYGLDASRQLVVKAQAAQTRSEEYLFLIGRVSDYGNAVAAAASPEAGPSTWQRVVEGYALVERVFDNLKTLNAQEVASESGDAKTAAATKGLALARMRAQFEALHRNAEADLGHLDFAETVQARLDAFGLGFAPNLAQAIEDERQLSRNMHAGIDLLRKRLTFLAVFLTLAAVVIGAATYLLAGRPLMRRISETIAGAEAIAAGNLETRLKPTGRDELTRLMNTFNAMGASLGAREADLKQGQRDLQATIDRQTAELRAANERLEEIDANRRRFFSDISHELRTPLTVIQGEADFNLKPRAKTTVSQVRKSFETILSRVLGLRRRVDDMLRVARSESGRLDLNLHPLDMRNVISEAVASDAALASRKSIELRTDLHNGIARVTGDRDWLRQVVSGLIANAVKHTPEGGSIDISCVPAQDGVELEVRDTGTGVAEAELERVFDRFIRGKDAGQVTDGFGIGLSLAKWVVEEHGGTITMANNSDEPGANVRIRLPAAMGNGEK